MRPVRSAVVAAGIAVALVASFAGVAEAQELYTASITGECNTTTGQYDVTVTLSDTSSGPVLLSDAEYSYLVPPETEVSADTAFSPSTLENGASSSLSVSVPGESIAVTVTWYASVIDEFDATGIYFDGDCMATTTTTATPTTAGPTTTAGGAAGATATPRFTG